MSNRLQRAGVIAKNSKCCQLYAYMWNVVKFTCNLHINRMRHKENGIGSTKKKTDILTSSKTNSTLATFA